MAYDGQIPFDGDGNQQHYPDRWTDKNAVRQENEDELSFYRRRYREPVWTPNHEFEAVLTFNTFNRGRSAAYAEFLRETGKTVIVFLADLENMIPYMSGGAIRGRFTFCKRGQNFGCKLVESR